MPNHPDLLAGTHRTCATDSGCWEGSWLLGHDPSTPAWQLCGWFPTQPTSPTFFSPPKIPYKLSTSRLSSDPFPTLTQLPFLSWDADLVLKGSLNFWHLHGIQCYRSGWTQRYYLLVQKKEKNPGGCNGLEAGCANQFHNECISLWSPLLAHNRIEAVFCFAEISTFKTCSGFIISARACTSFLIHCCKIQRDRTAQKITAKM